MSSSITSSEAILTKSEQKAAEKVAKVEAAVNKVLKGLLSGGDTIAAITKKLENAKIKGDPGVSSSCPIALYFRAKLDKNIAPFVEVSGDSIDIQGKRRNGYRPTIVSIPLSKKVTRFIDAVDNKNKSVKSVLVAE